jgi:LPS-assembly lipoprotein
MSSFNRRRFLLASSAAAALSACGFTPAYGPSGAATRLQDNILVDAPKSRDAYLLTQNIEERLGRASSPRFGLSYAISTRDNAIAITAANTTNRFNIEGSITYALRDLQTGAVVTTGKVDSFTSYSASGSTVATQAAERDAHIRLMTILSDQIVTRLIAASPGLPA